MRLLRNFAIYAIISTVLPLHRGEFPNGGSQQTNYKEKLQQIFAVVGIGAKNWDEVERGEEPLGANYFLEMTPPQRIMPVFSS